jgi:ABC-type sugar transport system permease subunit
VLYDAPSPVATWKGGAKSEHSTLWRATRLILAWVSIVLIVQLIIGMGLAMAAGASIVSRLADPTPAASECVGEVCD